MRKIKSKDEVIVITGRDKGRRGKVLRCVRRASGGRRRERREEHRAAIRTRESRWNRR